VSVTWLHISDFHVRTGDPYDRDVVLGALVKSVADYRRMGRVPDLIFATGDIVYSGKPQEYELAEKFFDDLLRALELDKRHLFLIPGNHDVDRDLGVGLARTLGSREEADKYFNPERGKPHLNLKMGAFRAWYNRYFDGVRTLTETSTCGPVELVKVHGRQLGILPINSGLFCQDDNDHGKLWVGRRCLDQAIVELKRIKAELNIALIHHPVNWLSPKESSNIQAELDDAVHILLRGHLHDTKVESAASPEGELFCCAAGAAYDTREWPNRAIYASLEDDRLTIFPIRYEDDPRPIWTTDPRVFPRDPDHQRTFQLPKKTQSVALVRYLPEGMQGQKVNRRVELPESKKLHRRRLPSTSRSTTSRSISAYSRVLSHSDGRGVVQRLLQTIRPLCIGPFVCGVPLRFTYFRPMQYAAFFNVTPESFYSWMIWGMSLAQCQTSKESSAAG
jgi:predicted phosphodiesterase